MPEYPHGLTLAEVSKKSYDCKKCGKKLKYAKFFKPDNSLLTNDGCKPNGLGMEKIDGKWVNHSNVFSTSVLSEEGNKLHECYEIKWPEVKEGYSESGGERADVGDNSGNTSETKTDGGHNSPSQKIDKDLLNKWDDLIQNDDEMEALARYQVVKHQPNIPDSVLNAAISAKVEHLLLSRIVKVLVGRPRE